MDKSAARINLREDLDRVNDLMSRSLSTDIDLLDHTNGTLLGRRGKQLRPTVALLTARACGHGACNEDTIRFAAASELLHNATLLHDDVADDSTERRGAPTVMSLLGSRAAVLLGDFWLVKAMGCVLDASVCDSARVIRIFSRTLSDLAEGEMLQLQKASSADTTEEDYLRIIYGKTASLFVTAALSAAISVGAAPAEEAAVRAYAGNLGIAFQIRDDIFDYEKDAVIGKPVGQDLHEQKITLPLLGALRSVPGEEQRRIRNLVLGMTEHPGNQEEIVEFVRSSGGVAYARRRLDEYVDKAVAALDGLPAGRDRDELAALARFAGERTS